ncbi:MAG: hypothetical protein FGF50_08515 [Candidatus Brockarchaeota archaeon]|nr:hypothetical protein [Candidatus Brockarchaeota archaeon]
MTVLHQGGQALNITVDCTSSVRSGKPMEAGKMQAPHALTRLGAQCLNGSRLYAGLATTLLEQG